MCMDEDVGEDSLQGEKPSLQESDQGQSQFTPLLTFTNISVFFCCCFFVFYLPYSIILLYSTLLFLYFP